VALVLDTGVVLALLNARDRYHRACVQMAEGTREPFVIPAAILGELDYWISKRMEPAAWRIFVEDIDRGAYLLEPTTEDDLVRTVALQAQYPSLSLGFVDAAVIAVCERLGERKVATVDRRDFSAIVPRHAPYLELLPAELA
jgi:predicted nucleic acid-binding protein